MPKRTAPNRQRDADQDNALIRHHIEEVAVHLGMVRMLTEGKHSSWFDQAGSGLKKLYVRYGGHPDA